MHIKKGEKILKKVEVDAKKREIAEKMQGARPKSWSKKIEKRDHDYNREDDFKGGERNKESAGREERKKHFLKGEI